jgi:hypothetical protein
MRGGSSVAVPVSKLLAKTELISAFCGRRSVGNGRYDLNTKNALKAAGGVGFMHPACTAYEYVPGQAYTGGQRVTCDG